MKNKYSRGVIIIFAANALNLIANLLATFFLPKYLSIETYAMIRTYQLYMSYAGVMSLGYVDGMYLEFGGKELKKIGAMELSQNIWTMRIFQTAVVAVMAVFGLFLKDSIFLVFLLSVLPFNMAGYYKQLYQATGEFQHYSRLLNITTYLSFAANLILLFVFHSDHYLAYITTYLAIYFALWLWIEYRFFNLRKDCMHSITFNSKLLFTNVKSGILLMLGNFSSIIMTSLDRWLVKAMMDTVAFAQYSFAVSVENVLSLLTLPISTILYNYFCKHTEKQAIYRVLRIVVVFSTIVVACFFPVKYILETWLVEYRDSTNLTVFLFAAHIYYITVKSIYVNMYKARKMVGPYVRKMMITVLFGIIVSILLFFALHKKEAFSIGTMVTAIAWFVSCLFDFRDMPISVSILCYIVLESAAFILCGIYLNAWAGMLFYILISAVLLVLLMRETVLDLYKIGVSLVRVKWDGIASTWRKR